MNLRKNKSKRKVSINSLTSYLTPDEKMLPTHAEDRYQALLRSSLLRTPGPSWEVQSKEACNSLKPSSALVLIKSILELPKSEFQTQGLEFARGKQVLSSAPQF